MRLIEYPLYGRSSLGDNKLAFHGADTDTNTLADFRARIVHEPDTHEDPRRLVRHAARFSSRGCPLGMRACTHSGDAQMQLSCTRLQNKKHLKNVGPIRHCEPPHVHSPGFATVARAHRCPRRRRRRRQRQRVTEGTAMAP